MIRLIGMFHTRGGQMFYRRILACFSLFLFTGLTQAQSILVDNFNTGVGGSTINLTLSSAPNSVFQFDSGLTTTIGGQRLARLHNVSGAGTTNLNNTTNTDILGMSLPSSQTIQAHFHLYYGYDAYDPNATTPIANSHTVRPLNTNTTATFVPQFTFDLIRLDVVPSNLKVTLVSDFVAGTPNTGNYRTVTTTFNSSVFSPGITVNLTQADFAAGTGVGSVNWSDIDMIIFETGDLIDSTDLRIDNLRFTAVPEPTTYALIGLSTLAAGGVAWNRRRRSRAIENQAI